MTASDPEPGPIREVFVARHNITPDESVVDVLARISVAGPVVNLDRITGVAAPTFCELAGITIPTWNGWAGRGHGPGKPPRPRWHTNQGRQGSSNLWIAEVDLIPWLIQFPVGRGYLERMVEEMQEGLLYPVFRRLGSPPPMLEGFRRTPPPEPPPARRGRPPRRATVNA